MRVLVLLLTLCLVCFAQGPNPSHIAGGNLPALPIGPNDLLALSVYDAPEFTRTVRVGSDGAFRLPMIEEPIDASGKLPAQLETDIVRALEENEILVDPVVTVTVAEYHSRPVSVAGAVEDPITFQAIGDVTLLDALTRAGGLAERAGPEILLTEMRNGREGVHTRRIPVKSLIEGTDPSLNVRLTGGEEILIPEVGQVFVVGNVRRPGQFSVPRDGECTLLEVLAMSEGLMPYAAKTAYIYRRDGSEQEEIPVALRKIMKREAPDVALLANDILYVPDNRGRRVGIAALEKILQFGSTAGATALIYGSRR
jgi:polysaccharide export outer membrane protein